MKAFTLIYILLYTRAIYTLAWLSFYGDTMFTPDEIELVTFILQN